MFAEADTSSDGTVSEKGDEEDGRKIAEMDDAPSKRAANASGNVERGCGELCSFRRDWVKSSRFERFYEKGKAVTKTNANLLEEAVQDQMR